MNRIALLTLLVCGIIGVGIVVVVRSLNPPAASAPVTNHQALPDDPRLVYPTPFRNVKPSVTYVGDAACATCHPSIDKAFHAHPMGRSADWVATSKPDRNVSTKRHNPTVRGEYTLTVDHQPTGTVHRISTPLGECRMTSDLAIDLARSAVRTSPTKTAPSGKRQSVGTRPIVPCGKGDVDVSPGFDLEIADAATDSDRLFILPCGPCRTDRRIVQPLFASRFWRSQASIGCERCHGPGSLHVDERISTPMVTLTRHLDCESEASVPIAPAFDLRAVSLARPSAHPPSRSQRVRLPPRVAVRGVCHGLCS